VSRFLCVEYALYRVQLDGARAAGDPADERYFLHCFGSNLLFSGSGLFSRCLSMLFASFYGRRVLS